MLSKYGKKLNPEKFRFVTVWNETDEKRKTQSEEILDVARPRHGTSTLTVAR